MRSSDIIFEYALNVLGGVAIGVALLSQFFINARLGKIGRCDSTTRKIVAYSIRIGAATISFAVLVFVIRMIRSSTTVTLSSALAIAIGLLATLIFGRSLMRKV